MSIWFKPESAIDLNAYQQQTLVSHLGIRYPGGGRGFPLC
jgi:hypothetical protein